MKNLFESTTAEEVKTRIHLMGPDSRRQWGTMSASQTLAHCAAAMEWAVGDTVPPRTFFGRIAGTFVKPILLGNEAPMRHNAPTIRSLVIRDEPNLQAERERLCGLIERFSTGGPALCTTNPHSFFGRLTPGEWATLMYKHLDHHLRQFGV